LVKGCGPVPSGFITQIFLLAMAASVPLSAREDMYAIFVPSGDHAGDTLAAKLAVRVVTGVAPLPSALTIQILAIGARVLLPSRARVESNAILVPSGDHAGWVLLADWVVSLVSGIGLDPSACMTHTFTAGIALLLPSGDRRDSNAIFVPSGDHTGETDEAPAAVKAVRALVLLPSVFMSHIFVAALLASLPSNARNDVNTILPSVPCCETVTLLGDMVHPKVHNNSISSDRATQ
jgi:hypothetical protein